MKIGFFIIIISATIMCSDCSSSKNTQGRNTGENELLGILKQYPQYFDSILQRKDDFKIQIIYTQINRDKNNQPSFTDFYFNINEGSYFYPASTVKLPVAVLALQKLNELAIPGLDKNTTMFTGADGDKQTEVLVDSSAADSRPTIAHYIKKILLVSDNDAFNRLYEFLGQDYINTNLHKMGYADIEIIHRLSISLTESQNRRTNPVRFIDSTGKLLYEQVATVSNWVNAERNIKLGKGYMQGDELINEPFDFSRKNRMSLQSLHAIVRAVLFPEAVPATERFDLNKEDYDFLRRYMSMRPGEAVSPVYPAPEYWDNYIKMIYYGSEKTIPDPGIRIFNKTGTAYGFLIDAAYVADYTNAIEFMLSAVIYCNSDGIFNDDKYDYDTLGYPFLKHLGRVIYDHELKRKRKYKPNLSSLQFEYGR
jgi:hypothetical protein